MHRVVALCLDGLVAFDLTGLVLRDLGAAVAFDLEALVSADLHRAVAAHLAGLVVLDEDDLVLLRLERIALALQGPHLQHRIAQALPQLGLRRILVGRPRVDCT